MKLYYNNRKSKISSQIELYFVITNIALLRTLYKSLNENEWIKMDALLL